MPTAKRCPSVLLLLAVLILAAGPAAAGPTRIKVALITPEGSTWTNTLHEMADALKNQTGGEVELKIYAGGVSGDELDVLRKMQANRIHAAGFSGVGLGVVLPQIRILEAPLLFGDDDEIDYVKERLYDGFAADFEKKGYVLLGFAEAGFVYFYTNIDPSGPDAIRQLKMWAWKGDPVAQTFLETFGIRTFPLHLADVNTGLETGMIDSFYSPPLAAVAFQWYSRIQYMLDYPMVNSTGAFLMNKRIFDRLSEKNQAVLKDLSRQYCRKLVELTRKDNQEARSVLEGAGVTFVVPSKAQKTAFAENARQTWDKNMPGLYPRALFDQVRSLLEAFRKKNGG
ncbi:MAG: TRAP transporter substrate-binding protein DctP [Desulfobacterales bacterium]|nr:TRAP transporter substrate-binding protein DctP [Desulfobacterales bacterium]